MRIIIIIIVCIFGIWVYSAIQKEDERKSQILAGCKYDMSAYYEAQQAATCLAIGRKNFDEIVKSEKGTCPVRELAWKQSNLGFVTSYAFFDGPQQNMFFYREAYRCPDGTIKTKICLDKNKRPDKCEVWLIEGGGNRYSSGNNTNHFPSYEEATKAFQQFDKNTLWRSN